MSERATTAAEKASVKSEHSSYAASGPGHAQVACSPFAQVIFLQRTVGNQAVGRLILQSKVKSQESGGIQAKLSINKPDDIYEQEADRVADTVMRMPEKEDGSTSGISQFAIRNPKSAIQRKPG